MHALESSPLTAAILTYALNALWQVPLVFAAARMSIWLAARASRPAGPAFQHRLWTAALFTELLLPAISASPATILQTLEQLLSLFQKSTPAPAATITITMGPANIPSEGLHLPPTLLAAAAILYLATLLYFATRLALGLHQTASLRRRAHPISLAADAAQRCRRLAHLFRVPNALIASSAEIASPITLGIRRPTLLLPTHIDATLLPEDLDAALAHEFAHIRRRDFAKNLLYELLSLPIAFHPILRLTRRRMAETRELVCDRMAAEAVAGPQRYARSLLRLATHFATRPLSPTIPTPHAIGIFDAHPFKHFERRIMNLTHHSPQLRGVARLIPAALSLTLISAACTSALAFRQQVATPQTTTSTSSSPGTSSSSPNVALVIPDANDAPRSYKLDVPADSSSALPPGSYTIKLDTPPDAASGQSPKTIHVSAGVIAGNRTNFKAPIYPPEAKKAKLSGTVVLKAIIGKDGTISNLSILSSTNPIFNNSALEAVHHWTYKPYLLNGEPTEVDTTITINYALNSDASPNPQPNPDPQPNPQPEPSNLQSSAVPSHVMHIGGDVKPPVVVHTVSPEFSQQAKTAKFSGNVEVYLVVDKNGYPTHVRVVKGVGRGLDEKAVEAVSQYRFKPATYKGQPVPVDLYVDVNFQIL